MLRLDYLQASEARQPYADTINSFSGPCRACCVHGFARLARFVTPGGQVPEEQRYDPNSPDGSFWFAEEDFPRLKRQAEANLSSQGNPGQVGNPPEMYLRHQFRSLSPVCRDWTRSFGSERC